MNDYYEDEYDEFDDYEDWDAEPQISETSVWIYVHKGKSGHVVLLEVSGYRYFGQDWGETSGQWRERYVNLNVLYEDVKAAALKQAKDMQPGETEHFYYEEYDDSDPDPGPDGGYGDPYPTEDDPNNLIQANDLPDNLNDIPW